MGYDVHITRTEHWLDSKDNPIPLPEWLKYVESDPEMRPDKVAVARVRRKPVLTYRSEGLAVWVAYPKHDPEGNMAWFDWREGRIVVKNPDDELLGKMKRVAAHFGAFVVGDDGEHY